MFSLGERHLCPIDSLLRLRGGGGGEGGGKKQEGGGLIYFKSFCWGDRLNRERGKAYYNLAKMPAVQHSFFVVHNL